MSRSIHTITALFDVLQHSLVLKRELVFRVRGGLLLWQQGMFKRVTFKKIPVSYTYICLAVTNAMKIRLF